jgi:class 3 adenylate cyclase
VIRAGYSTAVTSFSLGDAAARADVSADELRQLVALRIVTPGPNEEFTAGDVRRISLVHSVVAAGIPLDGLGAAVRSGKISLDFLDAPAFERFSALSHVTFAQFAERAQVPVELLMLIREAAGSPAPRPEDRIRDEELPYAEFVELQVKAGFRPAAIQQLLRVQGDSLRRMAEMEAAWWESEVVAPGMEAGRRPDEIMGLDFGDQMSVLSERALLGMWHLQQTQTWTGNIITGLEKMLAAAGLYSRLDHPPAMCFLDITGYSRLTQEHGDTAAATLAEQLGRLVQRTSVKYGGRSVKWLGDGVMLFFPNPGPGVVAALDMVDGVADAGLPPAHVGLHVGPVIFQEGDYYGATVNVASRIADYARPGEVLVSQEVVDAAGEADIAFRAIGPVELKGVPGAMQLLAASRAP